MNNFLIINDLLISIQIIELVISMYYFDLRHNVKEKRRKGKSSSSLNAFYYIQRLKHFAENKNNLNEEVEYKNSGNMPSWVNDNPKKFWAAADKYERGGMRTSSHITIALPSELNKSQRIELVENLVQAFTGEFELPHSYSIHNHKATLDGDQDQPHLHLIYSERTSIDQIDRPPEQFFNQYRPKNPERGGAQKITEDLLGQGRQQIMIYRRLTEKIINESLEKYAPSKFVEIRGLNLEVPNVVSCLSNEDYNQQFGTQLKLVPQIPRWMLHSADPIIQLDLKPLVEKVKQIRQENTFEMYKPYYFAELNKRKKLENNNDFSM